MGAFSAPVCAAQRAIMVFQVRQSLSDGPKDTELGSPPFGYGCWITLVGSNEKAKESVTYHFDLKFVSVFLIIIVT